MSHQTRISTKKSSFIPPAAKFSPPPVLQPKASKKPDRQLPEWQPEGGGMVSPLQRLLDSNAVQAKLTIGEPNDKYEQEADTVAQDVVQRLHSPVSEAPPETEVQRETEAGKHKLQMKPILQRTHAVGGEPASADLEGAINRAKGGGQPLEAGLQRSMSQAMGADFSGVRVHTDGHADELNQSIQAKAFTTGQDVFFKQGAYQPGSRGGQELIAHELTHVVQQGGGGVQQANVIQCVLDMDDQDWVHSPELFQRGNSPEKQFKKDTAIWYNTLFTPGQGQDKAQNHKLAQQQAILKRHFLAMSILGVQAGNQNDPNSYQALENTQQNVPLAALASHGGRFGYEASNVKHGQAFRDWLFVGNRGAGLDQQTIANSMNEQGNTNSYAGLYNRRSTHGQKYQDGHWKETKTGGTPGLGMNIALGGVGNQINDKKNRPTKVGYEGYAHAQHRGNNGGRTDYQLGAAVFGYDESKSGGSRLMVGFEGTAPHQKNQLGAEHGVKSTLKSFLGQANEVSLTGQEKAGAIGLPSGKGALKSGNIDYQALLKLQQAQQGLEGLTPDVEQEIFKALLSSTNQQERDLAITVLTAPTKEQQALALLVFRTRKMWQKEYDHNSEDDDLDDDEWL